MVGHSIIDLNVAQQRPRWSNGYKKRRKEKQGWTAKIGVTDPKEIGIMIMSLKELGLGENPTLIANTMYMAAKTLRFGKAVVKDFENQQARQ